MGDGHYRKTPPAPGQRVFVLAVTDYFTKWIEVEAFSKVRDCEVIQFIWKKCDMQVWSRKINSHGQWVTIHKH